MTEVSFAKTFLATLDSKTTKYQSDHTFNPAEFDLRIPYTLPKLQHPQHPSPLSLSNDASSSTATVQKAPGAEPATTTTNTINVTLTSSRNPSMSYTMPSAPPSTTVASIKQQIHEYLGGTSTVASVDKIKILHNKKPIPASKISIADVVGDSAVKKLELGVMVMGGAPDPPPPQQQQEATAVKARAPEPAGPGSENAAVEAVTGLNPADTTSTEQAMEGVQQTLSGKSESISLQPGEANGSNILKTDEFWIDLEGFLAQRIRSQEEATKLRQIFERAWRVNAA